MNNIIDFAFSKQGYSHKKIDKICQDASGSYSDKDFSIAVVADGHGGDNYPRSDRGSKFAVEVTIDLIKEMFCIFKIDSIAETDAMNDDNFSENLQQLAKSILNKWHEKVESDVLKDPFEAEELVKVSQKYKDYYLSGKKIEKAYGSTLIAIVSTEAYWFGLQIGDGKCVAFGEDGNPAEPIPWDDTCQNNVTTSICDDDAIDEFRFFFAEKSKFCAVFAGCDGIDDSYSDPKDMYSFYGAIASGYIEKGDIAGNDIEDYLPELSRRGSGDDVSIVGLIDKAFSTTAFELIRARSEFYSRRKEFNCATEAKASAIEREKILEEKRASLRNSWEAFSLKYNKEIKEVDEALTKAKEDFKIAEEKEELLAKKTSEAYDKLNAIVNQFAGTDKTEVKKQTEIDEAACEKNDASLAVNEDLEPQQSNDKQSDEQQTEESQKEASAPICWDISKLTNDANYVSSTEEQQNSEVKQEIDAMQESTECSQNVQENTELSVDNSQQDDVNIILY